MVVCPECSTEYEKEAKYCFKCRIAFTDDIPENISKYLRRNVSSGSINKGFTDTKPPLTRNTSLGGIKPSTSPLTPTVLNQVSSGTPNSNSNISPISTPTTHNVTSSASPPIPVGTHTNFNNISSNPISSGGSGSNRPRLASSPTPPTHPLPPSHPLPPTPNRMSVPVTLGNGSGGNIINSNNVQSPKPPISPTTITSPLTTINTSSNNTTHNNRTSPVTTSGSNTENTSSPLVFDQQPPLPQYNPLKRPLSSRVPPPPPNKKTGRAIWGCVPEQPGDLEFSEGDIITIINKDTDGSGWWLGSVNGKTGIFPATYIQEE